MELQRELEEYICHKIVRAMQIGQICRESMDLPIGEYTLIEQTIDPHPIKIKVGARYVLKHQPQPGGYYVRYEDGYESFSPGGTFEAGYILIPEGGPTNSHRYMLMDGGILELQFEGSVDLILARIKNAAVTYPQTAISKTPIMRFFNYIHLPEALQRISRLVYSLARQMDQELPDSAEKSAGLRKLLEAKDCFVRANLEQKP